MQHNERCAPPEGWKRKDGSVVACTEKVKVLEENWTEVRAVLQDALDDAVLMGCGIDAFKAEYKRLVDELQCGYTEQNALDEPGHSEKAVK